MRRIDRRRLGGVFLGLLVASVLAGCSGTVEYKPSGPSPLFASMAVPGAVVDASASASVISEYRLANGLGPVAVDPQLMQLAAAQANAMARADKLSHTITGTPGNRARAAGYPFSRIAENVGAGHDTLADAFAGWRNSSPHRANMLMPGVDRIGIAVQQAPHSRFKVYWAMIVAEQPPAGAVPASSVSTEPYANRWDTFGTRHRLVQGETAATGFGQPAPQP